MPPRKKKALQTKDQSLGLAHGQLVRLPTFLYGQNIESDEYLQVADDQVMELSDQAVEAKADKSRRGTYVIRPNEPTFWNRRETYLISSAPVLEEDFRDNIVPAPNVLQEETAQPNNDETANHGELQQQSSALNSEEKMKGKQIQEEESIGEPGVLQEAKPKKRGRKKKSQMDPSDVASLPAEPEPVTKDGQEDLEVKPKRKNKSSLVPKENGSNEDNGTAEGANTKKRGRKKKEMVSGDALPVGTIDVNQAEKPKRGRKKKMETAVTDQVKENDASADLKKDQKRGRTKKNKPNAEDEGKEPMALEAP